MSLLQIYKKLYSHFGHQGWWPGKTRFEIIAGAVLTQNTNWRNVEKAIANLRKRKLLSAKAVANAKLSEIRKAVKPSGFYRQKARRLREIAKYFLRLRGKEPKREELLKIKGIGKETADSILLYAYGKPVFVVDAYTRRICERHGILKVKDYEGYRKFFESNLPRSAKIYNEFHALLVAVGKTYCRKKKPLCEGCPLRTFLPIIR